MNRKKYKSIFHPRFFDTLDALTKDLSDERFAVLYSLFKHEQSVLEKDPYNNSRECKFGSLHHNGFRTMTFHSKLPKVHTGDLRVIFKVDDLEEVILFFAMGKRINLRPRPKDDIYSVAEKMLIEIGKNDE